ncbi:endonuclease/exonuclease/phosphatase family protein [Sulfitobacter albidus]|uniref:Endonuclease/exonuclease/phosphatase family protein n=1 Tax=Sulfitobacter albidus TaxID=2829501 RepID=A0A975JCD1_9RHOB|nr:endonuclease/exonuclease/phosphatase family protein [Sulfitobacter albidus]QUJ75838.1 endonuclease/exonuclease/phosphatase family protein [Sulfitobacter albidus]
MIVEWILRGLAVLTATVSLLPLIKVPHGAIRGLAFPRQQIFWLCLFLLVAALWAGAPVWVTAVFGGCMCLQSIYIAKFTPLWRRQSVRADDALQADNRRHISVLTANVKMSNRDYPRLIHLTQRVSPDLLIAIETDQPWCAALSEALADDYPHRIDLPQDNGYGMQVFSRLTLGEVETRCLLTDGVPSIRCTVTLRSGALVRLYVLHPEPPVAFHDTKGRDGEIALTGMQVAQDPLPCIVTGDLNDVAWSTTTRRFQRLSGLADPRVGRGFYNTFNAFHWWARWPLDHLFHDPLFQLLTMQRLPKIGSDHFPLLFALALGHAPQRVDQLEEACPDETAEAVEMIREERDRDRRPIGDDWEEKAE